MGVRNFQGTPWHEERFHRNEGDERRYKGRCKYYIDSNNHCKYRNEKCIGSAHCGDYNAMTDTEFRIKQSKRNHSSKKTGEDDCYWYD